VNVYLPAREDGWTILDTGTAAAATEAAWQALLASPLRGERIAAVLVTHAHPDPMGMAGWLCERLGVPLLTSRSFFLIKCVDAARRSWHRRQYRQLAFYR